MKMQKRLKTLVFTFILAFMAFVAYAESVTISTFYPSPYGSYKNLDTTGDTSLATTVGSSVGIGISAPTGGTKLEVLSNGNNWYDGGIALRDNNANRIFLYKDLAHYFHIGFNGVKYFTIALGGNVGIGTPTPTDLLHIEDTEAIVSTTQLTLEGRYNGYGSGINFASKTSSNGTRLSMAKITADGEAPWNKTTSTQDANLRFFTTLDGSQIEKVRILANGNVGIGTTTPNSLLQVKDLVNFPPSINGTFLGFEAGSKTTTGQNNTAIGVNSLKKNTTGTANTAIGVSALRDSATGDDNTSIGHDSLHHNTTGRDNTAVGADSLKNNQTGIHNTAVGADSLHDNTTRGANNDGNENTAIGSDALFQNTTGDKNTAIGRRALRANTTGSNNTAVGAEAFLAGNFTNSTALGYEAQPTKNNQVMIGGPSVTEIRGPLGVPFSDVSDGRFKIDVKENVPGLLFINKLRPVTFHWDMEKLAAFSKTPDDKRQKDAEQAKAKIQQTGFIAQEVEEAALSIGYDFNAINKPENEESQYSLAYSEFTVPLVKAVQELDAENKKLTDEVNALKASQTNYETRLKELEDRLT